MALAAAPAAAQNMEIGGGFARQTWGGWTANGFGVDFARALSTTPTRSTAVIADFGLTRLPDFGETDTTFVGGVRLKFLRDRKVAVFAQGTAGLVRWKLDAAEPFLSAGATLFMAGGGGGVQIRMTRTIDLKAQVDVWTARDTALGQWQGVTRLLVGGVYTIGAK